MRLSSLGDLRKKKEAEEKDNKRGQEFYAGGVDQRGGGSGLAVEDPPDEKDILGRIVHRAQQNSAEDSGRGSGEEDDEDGRPPSDTHRITIWANGFQVNLGEFRPESDPANQAFLSSLASGIVPEELRNGSPNVNVALEDRRKEQYVPPPPPAYIAFSGDAMSLGSTSTSELVINPTSFDTIAPAVVDGPPSTVIQVKLLDGKKIKVKINQSSTIAQLAAMIIRDGSVTQSFSMSAGFPPKDVTDLRATIKDAGLLGASVMLKAA